MVNIVVMHKNNEQENKGKKELDMADYGKKNLSFYLTPYAYTSPSL